MVTMTIIKEKTKIGFNKWYPHKENGVVLAMTTTLKKKCGVGNDDHKKKIPE